KTIASERENTLCRPWTFIAPATRILYRLFGRQGGAEQGWSAGACNDCPFAAEGRSRSSPGHWNGTGVCHGVCEDARGRTTRKGWVQRRRRGEARRSCFHDRSSIVRSVVESSRGDAGARPGLAGQRRGR